MNLKNLKHIIKEEISKLNEQKKRPPFSKNDVEAGLSSAIQNSDLDDDIKSFFTWFIMDTAGGIRDAFWDWWSGDDEEGDSDSSSTP